MSTFGSSIDGVATNVTTETKTVQTGRTKTDVFSAFTTEQITAITVFHSGGSNS